MFKNSHKNITHTAIAIRTAPARVTKAMVAKNLAIKVGIVTVAGAALVVAHQVISSDNEN